MSPRQRRDPSTTKHTKRGQASSSASETKPPRVMIRWSRNLTLRSFAASHSFAVASMSDYGSAVLVPDRDEDGL